MTTHQLIQRDQDGGEEEHTSHIKLSMNSSNIISMEVYKLTKKQVEYMLKESIEMLKSYPYESFTK